MQFNSKNMQIKLFFITTQYYVLYVIIHIFSNLKTNMNGRQLLERIYTD